VHIRGLTPFLSVNDLIEITHPLTKLNITGEVISISGEIATAMMFQDISGLTLNSRAYLKQDAPLCPSLDWVGKTLNYKGEMIDGGKPASGPTPLSLRHQPPPAILRKGLGARLHTGVAALDSFLPLCEGQRIGLFAGSGVGKSTLLGTLAAQSTADINIIALIGERGREVRHFTQHTLGEAGMKKSIVFVATSDQPSAVKLRTAQLALAAAEFFRDQGQHVLCLFDSLTRYAEAHRDVALSAGEVPSLHAYPPSTFRALAQLCERAGPGLDDSGDISAIFSVLVAGGDMEEPVADMVRGILDGHIILDREIAERGRYPAINLRRSVSRSLPAAASPEENILLRKARQYVTQYEEAQTLIRAGLYIAGSDPDLDCAIAAYPMIEEFLTQTNAANADEIFTRLGEILALETISETVPNTPQSDKN